LNSIDLFCGAGGLTEGLRLAGIKTRFACDFDLQAIETFKYNHPNVLAEQTDVKDIDAKYILGKTGLRKGDIQLVVGGPPCQGFSLAGPRLPDDPKNRLVLEFLRIVRELEPNFFIFENVPGLLSMQGGAVKAVLENEFKQLGYSLSDDVVNSAKFGVPQSRPRFIMIGMMGNSLPGLPEATHFSSIESAQNSLFSATDRYEFVTVEDAFSDLPEVDQGQGSEETLHSKAPTCPFQEQRRGERKPGGIFNHRATRHSEKIQARYSSMPEGGSGRDIPERLRTKKNNIFRLSSNKPARTVTCNFRTDLIHPWMARGLTVREAARLQSFDDDYRFFGNLTRKAKWVTQDDQVGNAVPPLLARALGNHILELT
jgi:DNA (cytosine-5)-methyltransferase 1